MDKLLIHFEFDEVGIFIVWIILTYVCVMMCMFIDLCLGIKKAKAAGVATTSKGLRKTAEKAQKYFTPMLCLTFIDLLASIIIDFPVFTMLMGAFNGFCEFKSIFESTHQKAEIREAANTMQVIVKNKDDYSQMMVELLQKIAEDNESRISMARGGDNQRSSRTNSNTKNKKKSSRRKSLSDGD